MTSITITSLRRVALILSLGACAWTQGLAATDLANAPLSSTQSNAKPNLLFVLDDSGSMDSDYMPDDAYLPSAYSYRASQCNGLAYNPNITYKAPLTPATPTAPATQVSYLDMAVGAAWDDGYQPALTTGTYPGLRSSTSLDLGVSGSGTSKTLTIDSSYSSSSYYTKTVSQAIATYSVGQTVIIYSYDSVNGTTYGSPAQWMLGTVTAKTSTTITVNATFTTSDSSLSYSHWVVGVPATVSLTSAYYYTYSGTQPRMNWTYDSSTGALVSNTFYNECKATSGSTVFTKVLVSSLTAAQQTNYANWYSYYRTRILAMRAAIGASFARMTDSFRIGFTMISDPYVVSGMNNFLPVSDFTTAQRIQFYNNVYTATPNSYTPLRGALSKAGRYYANVAPGQTGHLISGQTTATPDPVQYTCQRNYTLMSTDGYWNTQTESAANQYGPYKLDGATAVGQQDGMDVRPQYDGSVTTRVENYNIGYTYAVNTPYTVNYKQTTSATKQTVTFTRVSAGGSNYTYTETVVTQPESKYQTSSYSTTQTDNYQSQQVRTVTYVNGTLSSDVYNPPVAPAASLTSSSRTTETLATQDPLTSYTTSGTTTTKTYTCTTKTTAPTQTCTNYSGYNVSTNKTGNINFTTGYTTYGSASPNVQDVSPSTGGLVKQNEVAGTAVAGAQVPYNTQTGVTTTTTGGSTSSLADVAEYYYVTPFRTSSTVNCVLTPSDSNCKGDLSPAGIDTATYQHMTTFTLGLGVNGLFKYDPYYLTQTSGDYYNVKQGKDANNNVVNWPTAYNTSSINTDVPGKIDDLWHAAVNGRGQYFTSSDTTSLATALNSVLTTVIEASGYGGSAAASSLKPVLGTDLVFLASYTTVTWAGDVKAFQLQRNANGDVVPINQQWSASDTLNARSYSTRNIYYAGSVQSGGKTVTALKAFNYTNLTADSYNGYFDNVCSKNPAPLQCSTLGTTTLTAANTGSNVVNYLRGDRSQEISLTSPTLPYRMRTSVLGDIINASPVFVGAPPFQYSDSGYADYVQAKANRTKVVYAAANDGMLHAFQADSGASGAELWAFIPTAVLPNLYRMVDTNYANGHQYYVDGSPVVGDVYNTTDSTWHTILVGGLNKGGKSYYALDVTDPANPTLLWEISNANTNFSNLGYTYGNPIITKVKDPNNTNNWIWAVAFASGYNNTDGSGDGNGTLYVVNALTGARLYKIDTTYTDSKNVVTKVGSTSIPSGLSKINVWITTETNNQAERFYGGDLLGNIWRFDVNGSVQPYNSALRLAQLQTSSTSTDSQPIQTRPELAEVSYGGAKYPVVLVGTGQYLGTTDLQDPTNATAAIQGVYAIKDPMTSTGWGPIRGSSSLVTQTFTTSSDGTTRTIASANAVDWTNKIGWTVALPTAKERVAIDMNLQYNTLGFITHIPTGTACSPSGKSWVYFLNVSTGASTTSSTVVGNLISSGLGTGITWFDLGNGQSTVLVPDDKLGIHAEVPPVAPTNTPGTAKRVSWRELVN